MAAETVVPREGSLARRARVRPLAVVHPHVIGEMASARERPAAQLASVRARPPPFVCPHVRVSTGFPRKSPVAKGALERLLASVNWPVPGELAGTRELPVTDLAFVPTPAPTHLPLPLRRRGAGRSPLVLATTLQPRALPLLRRGRGGWARRPGPSTDVDRRSRAVPVGRSDGEESRTMRLKKSRMAQ